MPSTVYMSPGNDDRTTHLTPIVFASASFAAQFPVMSPCPTCRITGLRRACAHMSLISAAGRGNALTPTHLYPIPASAFSVPSGSAARMSRTV
jgi:hypothetical protein